MDSRLYDHLMRIAEWRRTLNVPEGFAYGCLEEFVAKNGTEWTPAPRPKGVRQRKMGLCYMNAYQLVTSPLGEELDLRYVEGYACGVIPVLHAWAVTPDGSVVDPTWKDGTDYFGVVLPMKLVNKTMSSTHVYGVLDNWKDRYPLLREGGFTPAN